jgi:hypothetical protein
LQELDAPFPDMPAFDELTSPPMSEIEINPRYEFHVSEDE